MHLLNQSGVCKPLLLQKPITRQGAGDNSGNYVLSYELQTLEYLIWSGVYQHTRPNQILRVLPELHVIFLEFPRLPYW